MTKPCAVVNGRSVVVTFDDDMTGATEVDQEFKTINMVLKANYSEPRMALLGATIEKGKAVYMLPSVDDATRHLASLIASGLVTDWRGNAPEFSVDKASGKMQVRVWETLDPLPEFSGIAYDPRATAFVLTNWEGTERSINYLRASDYISACREAQELSLRLGQVAFDPAQVRIERHRASTTQGGFSIFYKGRCAARYADDIKLTGNKNERGEAEWAGYSDERILAIAERLYREGDRINKIKPLYLYDKLALIEAGRAVVLSDGEFDALAEDMPSAVASIPNPGQIGTKDQWLVGTKAALRAAAPVRVAEMELTRLVQTLSARYPDAGLSFGYIGNLDASGQRDDRSWRVFSKVQKKDDPANCHSWGGAGTDELPVLSEKAEKELETWVRRVIGKEPWPAVSRRAPARGNATNSMGM